VIFREVRLFSFEPVNNLLTAQTAKSYKAGQDANPQPAFRAIKIGQGAWCLFFK